MNKTFYGIPENGRIILYDSDGKKFERNQIPDAYGHEIMFGSEKVQSIKITYPLTFLNSVEELSEIIKSQPWGGEPLNTNKNAIG